MSGLSTNKPNQSICIVAHNAYGAMTGGRNGFIGGVERQTSMMARWLVAEGWRVSLITWAEGDPAEEMIDGVRVIKVCRQDAGIPTLRFFWPRWTSLNAAMRHANAQIYYQNCGECVTGQVALWCSRHHRRFVYSVASDKDCERLLPEMPALRERVLYRMGLRRADRVIVQTRRQSRMLTADFGVKSTIIPMPCVGPVNGEYVPPRLPQVGSGRVAWVGRVVELKRLEWLLEVAARLPEVSFDVVGPWGEDCAYNRTLRLQAAGLSNVAVLGPLERDRVSSVYRDASLLCCTSTFEGFPNTFLEAWSHGLPIVSTFDPDNLIAERELGAAAQDVQGLAASIRQLLSSPQRWCQASENARRYFMENHAVETAMPRFKQVFLDVLRK